jgi:hypothetical protein
MRTIISPRAALFGAIFYLIGIRLDEGDQPCTESAKGKIGQRQDQPKARSATCEPAVILFTTYHSAWIL